MKKRVICFCVCILFGVASLGGRVAFIIFSKNYTVSNTYNSYSLTLETLYPTVYYSGGEKLTNNSVKYVAVLKPNERALTDLHNLFSSSEIRDITNELEKGYPLIKFVTKDKKDNAKYTDIYEINSSEYSAKQLISASSSGLLKYLKPCGQRKISFRIDALGRMLRGDNGSVYQESFNTERGITLTLDKRVEDIAYSASEDIKSGCIIIMNVSDSSILACITKPDETYINKPIEQYAVGSVFKLVVAACALENNIDYYYTCAGKTTVGDTEFSCQKNHIHGFENLKSALANSCNCYFANLALKLGKDKLLDTAKSLGFSEEIKLYDGWSVKSANLPSENDLSSKGELVLFGFGQGKLTSSPLQICSTLCTIANYGTSNQVRLVKNVINENVKIKNIEYGKPKRVLKAETCNTLLKYMRYVVTDGTGYNAENSAHKSAGKTATAQTGQFFFGVEKLNTWFAGVYPCDNPKYAIVVMCENGKSGSEDCAPIYREIVEKLKSL